MSRQQSRTRTPGQTPRTSEPSLYEKARAGLLANISTLHDIDPATVSAIIAEGVLSNTDQSALDDEIERLASQHGGDEERARLQAFRDTLTAVGVSVWLPSLTPDGPEDDLCDVAYAYAYAYQHAGWLVGLAVGLAMGSGQPFAGVRPHTRRTR